MEQRLANTWHMSVIQKKFIETALLSDIRTDGRRPFDYRHLSINFAREYGSCDVQLGQTRVMSFVTAQLVQPYRDRPNEGSLAVYTEFSPMADPSFEIGPPGESAVELGRIIDRGLRESRAVDTESLCVLAGKLVWSIRVNLHIIDNGGNLVDTANIAALAALKTFRTPECTVGGEDGKQVHVHPPEVREPCALIVHHLPIAVTFAFITEDNILVTDPTYYEEAIMKGRMTVTINANEDLCAIQKAGEVGIAPSVVMQCLRIAAVKAAEITSQIENAVELYNSDLEHHSLKCMSSAEVLDLKSFNLNMEDYESSVVDERGGQPMRKFPSEEHINERDVIIREENSSTVKMDAINYKARKLMKGPSCWDPFSKGVDSNHLKASLGLPGKSLAIKKGEQIIEDLRLEAEVDSTGETVEKRNRRAPSDGSSDVGLNRQEVKSLKDAVKPKTMWRKLNSASINR